MFPIKICQAKLQSGFQVAYFHAYVHAIDSIFIVVFDENQTACQLSLYENRAPGVEFTAQLQFPNANIFARQNAISQSQRITQRLRSSQRRERWQGRSGRGNKLTNKYLFISGFYAKQGAGGQCYHDREGKAECFFSIFCICNIHSGLAKSLEAKILT